MQMKSLRRIVSLCTAGALAVGMTCDMASNGYASKSVISIENSPTGTSEELIAEESYLLNKDYVGISSPKDYNNDGVIDVFDVITLRGMIAEAEVSIVEFGVDLFDVHINVTETATFTAAVDSVGELEENSISVYDEDNNFITYLNDNGENGDEFADDGVYSGQADVFSDTRRIVQYYAATEKAMSNTDEISFWTEFTEEDINNFNEILSDTKGKSFDEVSSYLKECENIEELTVDDDNQTLCYTTTAGIPCIWGGLSETYKGTAQTDDDFYIDFDEYDIEMQGADAEKISTDAESYINDIINNPEIEVVHPDKTNVVVLQPFKDDFNANETSAFDVAGDLLAKVLQKDESATATKYNNDDVTLDMLKGLMDDETIGAVLFNGHGLLDNGITNFLFTGQKLKREIVDSSDLEKAIIEEGYEKDLNARRLYVYDDSNDKELNLRYIVNGKFFEYYYDKKESVKDTFWYLGACHSLQDGLKTFTSPSGKTILNPLADSLINLGAGAVVGFTDEVHKLYDRRTMCELIINNMILNQSTVSSGIGKTKATWADNVDSTLIDDSAFAVKRNIVATITYKGDSNFKFLENGYGDSKNGYGDFKYRITTNNIESGYPHFPIYYSNLIIYKKITPSVSLKDRRIQYSRFFNFHDYTIGSYPDIYYEDENNVYELYGNYESDETSGDDIIGNLTLPTGDYMFLANSRLPAMQYFYPPNDSELITTIEQTEYHVSYDMADIDNADDRRYATIEKDNIEYRDFIVRTGVKYEFGGVPGLNFD